jgi:hypothetical protein
MSIASKKPCWVLAECVHCGYVWVGCGLYRCPSCSSADLRVKNFFQEREGYSDVIINEVET